MRVSVDAEHCQGHTMCHIVAPEIFELDDIDGHASVPVPEVPQHLERQARKALASCPERAISLED